MLSLVDIGSGLWNFAGKEFIGRPGRRFFNDLEMMCAGFTILSTEKTNSVAAVLEQRVV